MVIHFVPKLVKWFFPRFTWNRSRTEKKIYLTFDDGPVPGISDFVLDELDKRGLKATFFVVGDNVKKYPHIALRVIKEGHQLGNHTFNHLRGSSIDDRVYLDNAKKCSEAIEELTGKKPHLFRPPYGRIRKSQIKALSADYEIIMWDVLSGDFIESQPAETCLSKTKKYTKSGSIVLFHDQEKTENIIKAVLPRYLDFIQAEGYETALL